MRAEALGLEHRLDLRAIGQPVRAEERLDLSGCGLPSPVAITRSISCVRADMSTGTLIAFLQPRGEAAVIGMNVRDEHGAHRLRRERLALDRFPRLLAHLHGHAGVDDHAAAVGLDQPHVDVVQIHRQRNARPAHARRDRDARARRGRRDVTYLRRLGADAKRLALRRHGGSGRCGVSDCHRSRIMRRNAAKGEIPPCDLFRTRCSCVLLALVCFAGAASAAPSATERALVKRVQAQEQSSIALLEQIVNVNSGTMNFAGVRKVGGRPAAAVRGARLQGALGGRRSVRPRRSPDRRALRAAGGMCC